MANVHIRSEEPADYAAIRTVSEKAFGQQAEAKLVDALREAGDLLLSLVAVESESDAVVGHIAFSRLKIVADGKQVAGVSLAPMAVLPTHQRQGIGAQLVREGVRQCAERGESIVIVVGHPQYYPRFGFSSQLAETLQPPFEVPAEAWMALSLRPDATDDVAGRVEYAAAFAALS